MKTFDIVSKINVYTSEECKEEDNSLIELAKNAAQTAYAPYSAYHVGAAVLLENGIVVQGSNQENAAYPSGLCAERTALFYANAQYPEIPVKAVAIAAFHNGEFTEEVCTPCGACRQVFSEIEGRYGKNIRILLCGKNKVYEVDSIKTLLPLSFGKEDLI